MTTSPALNLVSNGYYLPHTADTTAVSQDVVFAAVGELINSGFIVHPEDLNELSLADLTELVDTARKVGLNDGSAPDPMYPDFPKGVRETPTLVLLIDQIIHYLSEGELLPVKNTKGEKRPSLPVEDMVRAARPLVILTPEKAKELFLNKVQSPRALNTQDINMLSEIVSLLDADTVSNLAQELPDVDIRVHENRGHAVIACREHITGDRDLVKRLIKAALVPDALAVTVRALYDNSSEDLNTKVARFDNKNARYSHIPTTVKKAIAQQVVKVYNRQKKHFPLFPADIFVAKKLTWRRIFDVVHPFDYVQGEDRELFDIVRRNVDYQPLDSVYAETMQEGDYEKATQLLLDNAPGLLLRRAVLLASKVTNTPFIAESVKKAAERSTVTTVLSLMNAVRQSASGDKKKVITVAGHGNKVMDNVHLNSSVAYHMENSLKEALMYLLKQRGDKLGDSVKVGNSAFPVPLIQRDASLSDRMTMYRGQRTPVGDNVSTLRFFVHWKNASWRTDLDLGILFADEEGYILDSADYSNWDHFSHYPNSTRQALVFSGDIIDAPGEGAAEYFDADIQVIKEMFPSLKYIVMSVTAYVSNEGLNDIDHVSGVMPRSCQDSGEIFEPRTIASASTSTQPGRSTIPLAVDVETMEMLWCDVSTGSRAAGMNTASYELREAVKAAVNPKAVTTEEVLRWTAEVLGLPVDEKSPFEPEVLNTLLG